MIYYAGIPVFINTVAFPIHDYCQKYRNNCYLHATIICHEMKYIFKFDLQKLDTKEFTNWNH